MSLVGIAALVIGGAGIANAVSAFITRQHGDHCHAQVPRAFGNRDVTLASFSPRSSSSALIGIAARLDSAGALRHPSSPSWHFGHRPAACRIATAVEWQRT
jgi:hypothetical protein